MCRFFKNEEQLKLSVVESLIDIERHRELVGWVRSDALPLLAPFGEGCQGKPIPPDVRSLIDREGGKGKHGIPSH